MERPPWEVLGIERDATEAEIKKAYKRRAAATHPDRKQGDEEEFKAVAAAYEIMIDPEALDRWERTGSADKPPDPRQRAITHCMSLFLNLARQANYEPRHYIAAMREAINNDLASGRETIVQTEVLVARMRKASPTARGEENIFASVIEQERSQLVDQLDQARDKIDLLTESLLLLDEYDDNAPIDPMRQGIIFTNPTGSGTGTW